MDRERFVASIRRLAEERGSALSPDDLTLAELLAGASVAGAREVLWTDPGIVDLWSAAKREVVAVDTSAPPTAVADPRRAPGTHQVEPGAVAPEREHAMAGGGGSAHQTERSHMQGMSGGAPSRVDERASRLSQWREDKVRQDSQVEALSRWDINTLAESGATTPEELREVAPRLNAAVVVEQYADAISKVLTATDAGGSGVGAGVAAAAPALREGSVGGSDDGSVEGPWIGDGWFAPTDYSQIVSDDVVLPGLECSVEGGRTRLRWPGTSDGASEVVVYRVVESPDGWVRVAPEDGSLVGVTTQTEVSTEHLGARGAVSYLTVWANLGSDEQSARGAQGRVVAQGEILWPVSDLELRVTPADTVVGTVTAAPGTKLRVVRFEPGERITSNPSHVPSDLSVADSAFTDRRPPRATDLTYAVYSEVVLPNGQPRTSESYASATVRVDAAPQPVQLHVSGNQDTPGTWDLAWVPPDFGEVEVYLTDEPVPPGLGDGVLSREALERNGLTSANQLPNFTVTEGERVVLKECHVDQDWVRCYFTAVHVVGDRQLRVGPSVSQVRPAPPRHVQLSERVDSQILTFDWPRGVSMVEVHSGSRKQTAFDETSARDIIATIDSPDTYLRLGGLLLTNLPAIGCTLHLVGVIYDGGRAIRSAPATVDYPGLVRLRYHVRPARADGAPVTPTAPADRLQVLLRSDADLPQVHVALVANDRRLPLFPGDGAHLGAELVSLAAGKAATVFELPLGTSPAFVRLFVIDKAQADRVAVIDPQLSQMLHTVLR